MIFAWIISFIFSPLLNTNLSESKSNETFSKLNVDILEFPMFSNSNCKEKEKIVTLLLQLPQSQLSAFKSRNDRIALPLSSFDAGN